MYWIMYTHRPPRIEQSPTRQSRPMSPTLVDDPQMNFWEQVPNRTDVWYNRVNMSCGRSPDSSVLEPPRIWNFLAIRKPEVKHEVFTVSFIKRDRSNVAEPRRPLVVAVKRIQRPLKVTPNEHQLPKILAGTRIVQLNTILQRPAIDCHLRDHFMEHSMEITDAHVNIGDSSGTEHEKRQHTDGLIHAGSFEREEMLGGHSSGALGVVSLIKTLLLLGRSRPPRNTSERTFSTFSAPFGALSVASSSHSYDHLNEYTLEKGKYLGENATLLENVLDTLPINHPINFGEEHANLDLGDLPQGYPSLVCHCCNERLVSGVCSGKGAKGAVIFADSQIPGHNEFVKDPARAYWTWSSEEGNWWHQDEGTDTVVWAPVDFD